MTLRTAVARVTGQSSIRELLRSLNGAVKGAILATALARRGQFYPGIIGQSASIGGHFVEQRLGGLVHYVIAHGASGVAEARQQAMVALASLIRRHVLMTGSSDAFAIAAFVLGLVVVCVALAQQHRLAQSRRGA